jgi:hypothetical protein
MLFQFCPKHRAHRQHDSIVDIGSELAERMTAATASCSLVIHFGLLEPGLRSPHRQRSTQRQGAPKLGNLPLDIAIIVGYNWLEENAMVTPAEASTLRNSVLAYCPFAGNLPKLRTY